MNLLRWILYNFREFSWISLKRSSQPIKILKSLLEKKNFTKCAFLTFHISNIWEPPTIPLMSPFLLQASPPTRDHSTLIIFRPALECHSGRCRASEYVVVHASRASQVAPGKLTSQEICSSSVVGALLCDFIYAIWTVPLGPKWP